MVLCTGENLDEFTVLFSNIDLPRPLVSLREYTSLI